MAWNEPGNKGNGNDPWGGGNRGGGDKGPPDLDEVLKNLTDKVTALFGGKGGSGRGSGSGGGSGLSAGLLGGLILLLVVIWAALGFYTVDESERGVVLRFGKAQDEIVMPGLRWRPPLVDEVITVNVSRVNTSSYDEDMLTTDENIVNVAITVQYVIQEPVDYVLQVRDPRGSLDNAAESAIRHVVGSTTMDQVLTQGRAALAGEVLERLQSYMDAYTTGILVTQVNVENAQPPTAVQAAFDDVIRAREDEQRVQNEALAYANRVIPEARGEAQRLIEQANGYAQRVVAAAEGEAARFELLLAEYSQSPGVTRERLYIDAVQAVMTASSKVMIDIEDGNNMLYVPLDRIMEQRGGTSGATGLTEQQMREVTEQVRQELSSSPQAVDLRRSQQNNGRGGR